MTREILSSALDMIDERYISPVTDKKMHPIGQKSLYTYKIVEPSVWRKLLDVAAVLILVVGVTVGFILMRQSIGPGTTPGDSLTDTETEETTETETEPIETETEPTPDPVTISGVTYELRDGGYVVTGVTSTDANRAVLVDKIEDTPVIGIADGAFDSVDDPLNFRIFGYEDTFAREYAVDHGHIFIEYYNGKLPNHYYPEGGYLHKWIKRPPYNLCIAVDDNAEIDSLVTDYLNGEDFYDEILERVLYRMMCYYHLIRFDDYIYTYYTTEIVQFYGDYDRYIIYEAPYFRSDSKLTVPRAYEMFRFGPLETYEELDANAKLLFTTDILEFFEIKNVEGYIFIPGTGAGTPETSNQTCYIEIADDVITLHVEYFVDEIKHCEGSIEFQRTPNGWYFGKSEGDVDFVISVYLYKLYCGEIRNKYNNN